MLRFYLWYTISIWRYIVKKDTEEGSVSQYLHDYIARNNQQEHALQARKLFIYLLE